MEQPILTGYNSGPMSSGRTSRNLYLPTILFAGAALVSVILFYNAFTAHDYDASGPGVLDENYTERTVTHNGGSPEITYEMTYVFTVDGKEYKGKGTLGAKPQDRDTTVYYMANNPAENALKRGRVGPVPNILAWCFAGLAVLAFIWLQMKQLRSPSVTPQSTIAPPSPFETGPTYGDLHNEPARIKHGKHAAWPHVHFAFILQLALVGFLVYMGISHLKAAGSNEYIHLAIATIATITINLWIYYDRWRCIEAFSSKFCSGLLNLSILYVPVIAFVYANLRGIRKILGT